MKIKLCLWVFVLVVLCYSCTITKQEKSLESIGKTIVNTIEYTETISTGNEDNIFAVVSNLTLKLSEKFSDGSKIMILSVYSSNYIISGQIYDGILITLFEKNIFEIYDFRAIAHLNPEKYNYNSFYNKVENNDIISISNDHDINIVIIGEVTGTGSDETFIIKAFFVE